METNRQVTILEEGKKIGWDVGASDRFHVTSAFKKASNVETHTLTRVESISPRTVTAVQQTPEGERRLDISGRTVAVTLGFEENTDLYTALKDAGIEVYQAGDCASPARIADATKAGYLAAMQI